MVLFSISADMKNSRYRFCSILNRAVDLLFYNFVKVSMYSKFIELIQTLSPKGLTISHDRLLAKYCRYEGSGNCSR